MDNPRVNKQLFKNQQFEEYGNPMMNMNMGMNPAMNPGMAHGMNPYNIGMMAPLQGGPVNPNIGAMHN